MDTIRKFFALSLFMLVGVFVYAQKITVTKNTERFKGGNFEGYATELTGSLEEINTSFTKYLKGFGKVKATGNQFQVSEVQVNLTKYAVPVYASTKTKADKIMVWMGSSAETDSTKSIQGELEKLVYNFGVKFYKEKIQVDVDESIRAQTAAEKQQQRLALEGKNLTSRLETNAKEKIRLDKALVNNKQDSVKLGTSLAKNKLSQDSVAVATDQIKKMVEMHKERQRKVN